MSEAPYMRMLLKLSGEALMGSCEYGIEPGAIGEITSEIKSAAGVGTEIAIVIGGGNIFRGAGLASKGMDRTTADYIGMLGTLINALALQDALEKIDVSTRVMSAVRIDKVCEEYIVRRAIRHLEKGRVIILACGTGNPFFTTDTAASLRAAEISATLMLKATKVDGIYDADPEVTKDAHLYTKLSYDEVIGQELGVLDTTAAVICKQNKIPFRVFNVFERGAVLRAVRGDAVGTLVT